MCTPEKQERRDKEVMRKIPVDCPRSFSPVKSRGRDLTLYVMGSRDGAGEVTTRLKEGKRGVCLRAGSEMVSSVVCPGDVEGLGMNSQSLLRGDPR